MMAIKSRGMAFEDHLHVCQNCKVVYGTSSFSGPSECAVCGNRSFNEIDPEDYLDQ